MGERRVIASSNNKAVMFAFDSIINIVYIYKGEKKQSKLTSHLAS
jgi:hypothetical protein